MFEKIIFPTDFSKPARTELNCITSIPGIREIILLHVIQQYAIPMGVETIENLELETTEVYLHEAKAYIASLNPAIRVTLEETIATDITGAILEKAEEHHAGLIVIHAHIKGIIAGVLLNCVSSKVLCRISKINVMIMPNTLVGSLTGKTYEKFCPMIFSRVLCPTNFSEFSEKTVALVSTIKGMGEIILLHVVQKGEEKGDHTLALTTAEQRIHAVCDRLSAQGINARTIVVTGKPVIEITRVAQAEDVSLIWMRSAAQGCLHDFFFGSMVHDVVMNATRPVIVIRSYV
ncbi:MAG TPA: universal stress protein [Methanoregula sp.]|nr:universal stress protein [Methanoregula sp.]